jgi:hypothetical protein
MVISAKRDATLSICLETLYNARLAESSARVSTDGDRVSRDRTSHRRRSVGSGFIIARVADSRLEGRKRKRYLRKYALADSRFFNL